MIESAITPFTEPTEDELQTTLDTLAYLCQRRGTDDPEGRQIADVMNIVETHRMADSEAPYPSEVDR